MKEETKREKRLAIAQDVIAQLDAGRYKATSGVYFSTHFEVKKGPLKEQLEEVTPSDPCQVCGLGAVFASKVSLFNKFNVKENIFGNVEVDDEQMKDNLKEIFGTEMLNIIEDCFEQSDIRLSEVGAAFKYLCDYDSHVASFEARVVAIACDNISSDDTRMRFIMSEIISQDGDLNLIVWAEHIITRGTE